VGNSQLARHQVHGVAISRLSGLMQLGAVVCGRYHFRWPTIAGVWGNHKGSMVLWVLILALFGAGVATYGEPRDACQSVRAVDRPRAPTATAKSDSARYGFEREPMIATPQ
jgi:hypothetical protein